MIKLIVENELQKALFLALESQLSDGWWEDAMQSDRYHRYQVWMLTEDEISIGTLEEVGTYGIPSNAKRNFNFTNRQFLNIVAPELLIKTSCNSISDLRKNLKALKLAIQTYRRA
jgi:hypothetical protein